MADNVVITAGTGTTIHADEYTHSVLGSGKTQLVKLVDGTLNSGTPIVVDIGAKANALRVAPANDITDGTYIGDIKFGEALPAGTALLGKVGIDQVSANANEVVVKSGTVTTVSTVTNLAQLGGVAVSMNEGVLGTGVQRVTIATDDDSVAHLATIAGDTTSIDGKVTACNTGAVVLSSGTVTTVSTVTNLSQLGAQAISMGEGVLAAGCQRVTLATDDDGVAHLATIAGDTTSLDTKVTACNTGAVVVASGAITETNSASLAVVGGGVEATALRVTIANDSTGVVTVDGTVTANLSATDNAVLDTIDAVLDTINAKLVTGTVIGDVNLGATDNAVLDSIVTNTTRTPITDYGQAKLDHADVTTAQVLVAAVADKKFYITSIILSVAVAGSYWIEDDDAAQITCKYTLAANGGLAISFPIDTPYKSTTVNKGLKVKGSAAGVVGCQITYYTAA